MTKYNLNLPKKDPPWVVVLVLIIGLALAVGGAFIQKWIRTPYEVKVKIESNGQ